jgi:hypothetical protein
MTNLRSFALVPLLAATCLFWPAGAEGSHVRGGHLSWELLGPTVNGFNVRFHSVQEFAASNVTPLPVNPGDNDPAIIGPVNILFTGLDINGDLYRIIEYTVDHEYTAPGPFTAFLGLDADSLNCCRFDGLINAPNDPYRIETRVDLSSGANLGSPASSIPPVFVTPQIVQMPEGGLVTVDLAPGISDPDDSFSCTMAPTGVLAGASGISALAQNPNNLSVIAVASDCKLSWNTTGLTVGDRYAVQVTILEDPSGAANPVALDFIVEITAADCGDGVVQSGEDCDGVNGPCPGACRAPNSPAECTCPVCSDDILDVGEECDGTAGGVFGACPGECEPDTSPIACQCPTCGDDVFSPQAGEECDGTDDAACTDACLPNCACSLCGDNVAEAPVEACDGTDDDLCPGLCLGDCSCSQCGDGVAQGSEECDGVDDASCPGACLPSCACSLCGDDVAEAPVEQCDGLDSPLCPGNCLPDCSCPICGDGVAEGPEQCDGLDAGACPSVCLVNCSCAVCGDGDTNQPSEQCDGADDGACPGGCLGDCTCPTCGDGVAEGPEQCDGIDDAACPGACLPSGDVNECSCPVCGDADVNLPGEECDGTDDTGCPNACLPDCTCSFCGDDLAEAPLEECDGTDDASCPGTCLAPGHAFQCRCQFCGDGDVNLPGELCDPPTAEVCNNLVDDNDDGLVDCEDPLCSRRCEHDSNVLCSTERDCRSLQLGSNCLDIGATCGAVCETVLSCQLTLADPAKIEVNEDESRSGVLVLHTQFAPQSDVDPLVDGFAILVRNAQGDVYRAELPGSALVARTQRAYVFKDKTARDGPGLYDGIYALKITRRETSFTFRLRAYGDLRAATEARMTTEIVLGNDSTSLTAEWLPIKKGWRLRSIDIY